MVTEILYGCLILTIIDQVEFEPGKLGHFGTDFMYIALVSLSSTINFPGGHPILIKTFHIKLKISYRPMDL